MRQIILYKLIPQILQFLIKAIKQIKQMMEIFLINKALTSKKTPQIITNRVLYKFRILPKIMNQL
jgi:hypothetical protein